MPVRCRHCSRAGLPVVPGTPPVAGSLPVCVAHVKLIADGATGMHYGIPCWEGGSREGLIAETERNRAGIREAQRMLFADDAMWELDDAP